MGKQQIRSLIDGGASRSLLSLNTWIEHCRQKRICPLLKPCPPHERLKALNGGQIEVEGIAHLHVLGKIVPFHVVKALRNYDLLIGHNLLKIFDADINYKDEVVILRNKKFKTISATLDQRHQELASNIVDVDKWANEFPSVFKQSGPLPSTPSFKCKIDTGDHPPIYCKPYRLPLSKRKVVDSEIDRMLAEDIIEVSDAP